MSTLQKMLDDRRKQHNKEIGKITPDTKKEDSTEVVDPIPTEPAKKNKHGKK